MAKYNQLHVYRGSGYVPICVDQEGNEVARETAFAAGNEVWEGRTQIHPAPEKPSARKRSRESDAEPKPNLIESFKSLGMTEEEAKIAAAGEWTQVTPAEFDLARETAPKDMEKQAKDMAEGNHMHYVDEETKMRMRDADARDKAAREAYYKQQEAAKKQKKSDMLEAGVALGMISPATAEAAIADDADEDYLAGRALGLTHEEAKAFAVVQRGRVHR